MKSLERRFNNITRLNPYWSSYICFTEAIKEQCFSKRTITNYFNKLVEKDDYDKIKTYLRTVYFKALCQIKSLYLTRSDKGRVKHHLSPKKAKLI